MVQIVKLSCPGCGNRLDVHNDDDRMACAYCGSECAVQRRGGAVSLRPISAAIARVQVGTDRTAAELALVRLATERTAAVAACAAAHTKLRAATTKQSNAILWMCAGALAVVAGGMCASLSSVPEGLICVAAGTNSTFNAGAKKLAAANGCRLLDRDELGQLIADYRRDRPRDGI